MFETNRYVFPTCVGVNRVAYRDGVTSRCIPHVRGGEPTVIRPIQDYLYLKLCGEYLLDGRTIFKRHDHGAS